MEFFLSTGLADITLPEEPPEELYRNIVKREMKEVYRRELLGDLIIPSSGPSKMLNHKRLMMSYLGDVVMDDFTPWIARLSAANGIRIVSLSWVRRRKMTHVLVEWSTPFQHRARVLKWRGDMPVLRRVCNKNQIDRIEDFMKGH